MTETTRDWYLRAAGELAATSAVQVEWCRGIADDPVLLDLLDGLPRAARQPSLLFAVAASLGAPHAGYPAWGAWVRAHAGELAAALPHRRVQTNEPARAAPLVVALAGIPGPIALLELGASAGLCLIPDRYGYRFRTAHGERVLGTGRPVLDVALDDPALVPQALPDIRWRRGIDLAPLEVTADDDVRLLAASLPPDRPERRIRLDEAIAAARADPPVVVAGDALAELPRVAADAPLQLTLVVAVLGTAVYLAPVDRARLLDEIAAVGARSVTFEARAALPAVAARWRELAVEGRVDPAAGFVLARDGEPLAAGTPHGDALVGVRPAGRQGSPESRA